LKININFFERHFRITDCDEFTKVLSYNISIVIDLTRNSIKI